MPNIPQHIPQPIVETTGFSTPCWLWQGTLDNKGYGRFKVKGQPYKAHRVYYERFHGPIPTDHDVHHKCQTPACVNPAHLEALSKVRHVRLRRTNKLTLDIADEIRHLYASGEAQKALAARFGVSRGLISHIVCGAKWRP